MTPPSAAAGRRDPRVGEKFDAWAGLTVPVRLAIARGDEIWVWSFAEPVVELCAAVALASDASHAILGGEVGPGLRLWRSADRRELAVTCLRDFALSEFGAQGRGQVKVDRRGRVLTTDIHGRACFARSDGESEWLDVPAMATAVALAEEGEAFAVGFDDGGLVVWDRPGGEVRRWQFDTAIAELWLVGAGTAAIVLTRAEQVWAVRAGEEEPARLAGVPGATTITPLRVASQPKGAGAALALAAEEALISYDAGTGAVTRFPVLLARPGAIAYSASGARIAAAFAGEGVVVLPGTLDGPGIEVATREEVRGLAFVDEDELAALGESGALLRIDLALGECAPIQRRFDAQRADPATLVALPSGQSYALASGMLRISPVDPVPRDAAGLQAWIELRTRTDP